MSTIYLGIVGFLIVPAVFDLVVGVSNDAVNFLNSAIGAKVAKFKTIVLIAAIGVFGGAAMSNGMMDVARHGIMTPEFFSFYDVMCVFLAVMVTDVVLLDVFNTLGMPTSTTVSMVFELLGGSFAIALLKIVSGATMPSGELLTLGDLLNTEKALSVILGIFLSVAIAFILGTVVQWLARVIFTFTYRENGHTTSAENTKHQNLITSSLKIGIFSGICTTGIIWFLLINGLKGSSFMTDDLKAIINENTWYIIGGGIAVFSVLMTLLSMVKVPVLKFVVLLGTFALAMAFAGNDLVNFVGVPLTGLDAYNDYMANGAGDAHGFLMKSLMDSAHTPAIYLVLAGVVMVLSLIFSKKAQNVVKTSVDLSRQAEGDEMFGSSGVARVVVRSTSKTAQTIAGLVPNKMGKWIDSRFNADAAIMKEGAAFDQIRAAVNLVLAGILVAFGTSMKLPLSTTYVTFMVAMGTSLADRAWSRESAVFRITGVISVIGGWFITAGVAFVMCYLITNVMYFGSFVAMALAIALAIFLLVRSNMSYKEKKEVKHTDVLFRQILRTQDKRECWNLLREQVSTGSADDLQFTMDCYREITDAFFHDEYRPLRRATSLIDDQRKEFKRQRRRHIIGLRHIDPVLAVERNTWYYQSSSAAEQMLYCLKRINDPAREHIGNNFSPVEGEAAERFLEYRKQVLSLMEKTICYLNMTKTDKAFTLSETEGDALRLEATALQTAMSTYRKQVIDAMQRHNSNIERATILLNIIQESQQLIACIRHEIRGLIKFTS